MLGFVVSLLARSGLVLLVAALLCTAQAQTLRWAARSDMRSFDPYAYAEAVNHNLNALVHDALVERDARNVIVPALATHWRRFDPLTWRFTLREGVKFHDGTPFSAADAVFSIQRAQQADSAYASFARPLGTPVAIDASTLELRLARPNPLVLQQLASILMMSRNWAAAHQAERVPPYAAREQSYTATHAMGTGRYVMRERLPGQRTTFVRNRQWWGQTEGNVAEIVYQPIDNDATRAAALLSGDIDFSQDVAPQDIERFASMPSIRLASIVEDRLIMFGFDQWRDELLYSSVRGKNPLKDVRVREALWRAIDAPQLAATIMRGQAAPTGCLAIAARACAASELEARNAPDVARARRLMAAAGYPDGFDLTLDCPTDRFVNDRQLCVAIAGMLGRIGVRLKVEARPKSIHFQRLNAGDTSFYMIGWGGLDPDPQALFDGLLHSRDVAAGKGGINNGRVADAELDRLIDAAAIEPDAPARATLIRDVQRRAYEQVYYLPLHRQTLTWAMRANVRAVITADNLVRADWIRID